MYGRFYIGRTLSFFPLQTHCRGGQRPRALNGGGMEMKKPRGYRGFKVHALHVRRPMVVGCSPALPTLNGKTNISICLEYQALKSVISWWIGDFVPELPNIWKSQWITG